MECLCSKQGQAGVIISCLHLRHRSPFLLRPIASVARPAVVSTRQLAGLKIDRSKRCCDEAVQQPFWVP